MPIQFAPIPDLSKLDVLRFHTHWEEINGCWIWQSSSYDGRYGRFSLGRTSYPAHRVSYKIFKDDPGEELMVLHTCHKSKCVRPSHLYLGDATDNNNDTVAAGHHEQQGSLNPSAKLTDLKVTEIRRDYIPGVNGYNRLSRKYGVTAKNIQAILQGKTWRHLL